MPPDLRVVRPRGADVRRIAFRKNGDPVNTETRHEARALRAHPEDDARRLGMGPGNTPGERDGHLGELHGPSERHLRRRGMSVSLKHGTERPAEVEAKQGLVSGALPLKCGTGPLMMRLTGSRATREAVNGNPGKSSVVATGRGEPVPELEVQSPHLSRQSHH